jgi:hypothetical protein
MKHLFLFITLIILGIALGIAIGFSYGQSIQPQQPVKIITRIEIKKISPCDGNNSLIENQMCKAKYACNNKLDSYNYNDNNPIFKCK